VRIGEEVLKGVSESYRRLRNTIRFTIGALFEFNEKEIVKYDEMPDLEKWVLHRLKELDLLHKEAVKNYTFQLFYSELHTFCSSDLSAFYFDMRKDALYCDEATNMTRRSSRTVLKEIFNCLTAWLAPVLCYTADEAWLAFIGDENQESVHLRYFPKLSDKLINNKLRDSWNSLRKIRGVINGALEIARQDKVIGSSLEAKINIYIQNEGFKLLKKNRNLEELFIVSKVEIIESDVPDDIYKEDIVEGLGVKVVKADGIKCERCWKIEMINSNEQDNDLCSRCSEVIKNI